MDIPRLLAMNAYWAKHPPLHVMIQGFLGIEAKSATTDTDQSDQPDLLDMLKNFPQG